MDTWDEVHAQWAREGWTHVVGEGVELPPVGTVCLVYVDTTPDFYLWEKKYGPGQKPDRAGHFRIAEHVGPNGRWLSVPGRWEVNACWWRPLPDRPSDVPAHMIA